jgi:hypothetical protein
MKEAAPPGGLTLLFLSKNAGQAVDNIFNPTIITS